MKTKNKVNIKSLKKALQADKKLINKIKFYDEDRYTVTQNKEIKEALTTLVDGCLDLLVHWKDFEHTANLIEYKDDVYNFSDSHLNEVTNEVFGTKSKFFDLSMDEQDQVLKHILKEDGDDPFSFWEFMDDEFDYLRGNYLWDDDHGKVLEKYFINTRSLRDYLI
jgi:hypothetical protein